MANHFDDFEIENGDSRGRRLSFVGIVTILVVIAALIVVAGLVYVLTTDDNFITERFGTVEEEPLPTLIATLPPVPAPTEVEEIVDSSADEVVVLPPIRRELVKD